LAAVVEFEPFSGGMGPDPFSRPATAPNRGSIANPALGLAIPFLQVGWRRKGDEPPGRAAWGKCPVYQVLGI
jgi:hypothetical protein